MGETSGYNFVWRTGQLISANQHFEINCITNHALSAPKRNSGLGSGRTTPRYFNWLVYLHKAYLDKRNTTSTERFHFLGNDFAHANIFAKSSWAEINIHTRTAKFIRMQQNYPSDCVWQKQLLFLNMHKIYVQAPSRYK
jgi:hypothetical protein